VSAGVFVPASGWAATPARERRPHWAARHLPLALLTALALAAGGCLTAGKRTFYRYDPEYGVASKEFLNSLEALRAGMVAGNRAVLLENGDGFFPDMLQAIANAQHSVNLETYLFSDGEMPSAFARALAQRAAAGVEVRVLVDGVGARLGAALTEKMRAAGVQVRVYKPVRLLSIFRLGDRTHRRLLIIDGRIGYCGGWGIDDRWRGDARSPRQWRELAVRLDGPVVRQMQRIFMEDWVHTTGEVLHGERHFPVVPAAGEVLAQAIASSRTDQSSMSKLMFYMGIQAARQRIWISSAYFVPDRQIRRALVQAAQRGVDVRVVVPGPHVDIPPVRRASRFYYGELLAAGVRIYEYQPTMLHTKAMVVDSVWTSIGSVNFSNRSMKKNAEANVVVYDRNFAAAVETAIEKDIAVSDLFTYGEWKQRGLGDRLLELLSSLFSEAF